MGKVQLDAVQHLLAQEGKPDLAIHRIVSCSFSFGEIGALGKRSQSLKLHQPLTHVRHASQAARRLAGMTDVCQWRGGVEEPIYFLLQRVSEDAVRTPTTGSLSVYLKVKIRHFSKRSMYGRAKFDLLRIRVLSAM